MDYLFKDSRVLVVGGSGFIGAWIVRQCLLQGLRPAVLSRQQLEEHPLFGDQVEVIQGDLESLTETEYVELLEPFDKLVFAAGVDERVAPVGDAYTFYAHANIEPCRKLFAAAQRSGITHAVLLNSIFAMLHHQHPELALADRHPYIRSRVEQNECCQSLARDHFVLTTLEVPWVFGVPLESFEKSIIASEDCLHSIENIPQIKQHCPSQWDALIDYVRAAAPLLACRGGTSVISVESLAEACVAALHKPESSSVLAVGDINLSYRDLLKQLCVFAGRRDAHVTNINDQLFLELMKTGGAFKRLLNIQSGLNTGYIGDLLLSNLYVDVEKAHALLGYRTGVALQAMEVLVKTRPENRLLKNWRQMLNMSQAMMLNSGKTKKTEKE